MIFRFIIGVDVYSRDIVYKIPVDSEIVHSDGITAMHFASSAGNVDLLTIGTKVSRDLAAWNIESQAMIYKVDLNFYSNLFNLNVNHHLAVCGNSTSCDVVFVNIGSGDVMYRKEHSDLVDLYLSKSADHVLLASRKDGISVMDVKNQEIIRTMGKTVDNETLTLISLDPYEHFLFTGYRSGRVSVFQIASGLCITTLEGHCAEISSLFCWNQEQVCETIILF